MTSAQPRVGVGVLIVRDGLVLLGRRLGAHGAGTWAPPGGNLDFGESIADCAAREAREETGLGITDIRQGPFTENVFRAEGKHYITVFVVARCPSGEPVLKEPAKCERWEWHRWSDLPEPLFAPLESLRAQGFDPEDAMERPA